MSEIDLVPDVLVIGGGVAGVLAAARAKERGAKVCLVTKAGGGTASSSGAIDVADDLASLVPGPAHDALERGRGWRRSADVVAARLPRHPYARVGANGRERLRESLMLLKELAAPLVELVERDDGANHVVATQLGTAKRAALVQRTQLLDLSALGVSGDDVVGVVEPQDLAGFSARSVVHMLSWIIGLGQVGSRRLQCTPVVVERTLPGRELFATASDMARHLDNAPTRQAFCDALKSALRRTTRAPTHLLLPPILGWAKPREVHAEIEKAAGRPTRELLALPPSAPGDRLGRALLEGVRKRGVAIVEGHAVQANQTDGGGVEVERADKPRRATAVFVEGAQMRVEIRPKVVVLAGGRFFSGGVVRDGSAREPLFGLPLVANGSVVADKFIGDLLGQSPDAEHAIFRAGVAVDDMFRPLDAAGRVALENVVCAGSLVEGWDPARDGTGAGVAALTGLLAGERAAELTR